MPLENVCNAHWIFLRGNSIHLFPLSSWIKLQNPISMETLVICAKLSCTSVVRLCHLQTCRTRQGLKLWTVGSLPVAFTINIFTIKNYFHRLYFSRLTVLQKGKLTKKKKTNKNTQKILPLGTKKTHRNNSKSTLINQSRVKRVRAHQVTDALPKSRFMYD